MRRTIGFIIDLVQDVNILRPVIRLARTQTDADVIILASAKFFDRDSTGVWAKELRELCGALQLEIVTFASDFDAVCILQRRRGILISASESTVENHSMPHDVFRSMPSSFVKATLQHGLECVGFLHNEAHDRSYGRQVEFAADIICGWFGATVLRSVAPNQKCKLYVTGPPLFLEPSSEATSSQKSFTGNDYDGSECLICENLHSVRLGGSDLKAQFISEFEKFSSESVPNGVRVWFRSHPAGRYTIEKKVGLSADVMKSEGPIYKEDLGRYRFAISAPSSVLFDLILQDVPVAVWQDREGHVDCSNYNGLPIVSSSNDWWQFSAQIALNSAPILAAQRSFVKSLQIPDNVMDRYLKLFCSFG